MEEKKQTEEKTYLKEKEFPLPIKAIKTNDPEYLAAEELIEYMRSVEVIKPWEELEVDDNVVSGMQVLLINKVNMKKAPKDYKTREGTFFSIIQYKFNCDIKNGKIGKNSLANFTTYVKDIYSYSYAMFVLGKLKTKDKALAGDYADKLKKEFVKISEKKILADKKEIEKRQAEVKGASLEAKTLLANIAAVLKPAPKK